jgi:hypothetical protein
MMSHEATHGGRQQTEEKLPAWKPENFGPSFKKVRQEPKK